MNIFQSSARACGPCRIDRSPRRRYRNLALGLFALLLLARLPYAGAHLDMARDMFVAWRILRGEAFPLQGPILAGTIHLGPVWYYLLALLQALGRNWWGTMTLLGLLASLQIPLAYLLGKGLYSRRVGLLWAAGLLVPSWTTYEWMLPLHPLLSAPLVLGFLLCCLRFSKGGATRYLFGMALLFTLGLHAHPSNVGVIWAGALAVGLAPARAAQWPRIAIAALLGVLPLAPFFYSEALTGFADLRQSAYYFTTQGATGSFSHLPNFFTAIAYGGMVYMLDPMSGWDRQWARAGAAVLALAGAAGMTGVLLALRAKQTRKITTIALSMSLMAMLTVALMRDVTPYYMTTLSRVMLAGLVAVGLESLGRSWSAATVRALALGVSLGAVAVTLYGNAQFQKEGNWPFAWWPMFDVKRGPSEPSPLLVIPVYAMDQSGAFLCAQKRPSMHGSYGTALLHNYAMGMRLSCQNAGVQVGGSEPERTHWFGMARWMFAKTGTSPEVRIGPVGIVKARPVGEGRAHVPVGVPQYPAYSAVMGAKTLHRVEVPITASSRLAISYIDYVTYDLDITVRIHGQEVPPDVSDRVTSVYACRPCLAGETAMAVVDIRTGNFADVDMVLFGASD